MITDLEYLKMQQLSFRIYEQHTSPNVMTLFPKCNTKGTLCDDSDDACTKVHKTLVMSVKHVYTIRGNKQQNIYPLKQAKTPL